MDMKGTTTCAKLPTLDGKTSWAKYLKLLEAATRTNCWTSKEKAVALTVFYVVRPWMSYIH